MLTTSLCAVQLDRLPHGRCDRGPSRLVVFVYPKITGRYCYY